MLKCCYEFSNHCLSRGALDEEVDVVKAADIGWRNTDLQNHEQQCFFIHFIDFFSLLCTLTAISYMVYTSLFYPHSAIF